MALANISYKLNSVGSWLNAVSLILNSESNGFGYAAALNSESTFIRLLRRASSQ